VIGVATVDNIVAMTIVDRVVAAACIDASIAILPMTPDVGLSLVAGIARGTLPADWSCRVPLNEIDRKLDTAFHLLPAQNRQHMLRGRDTDLFCRQLHSR
jgi:hypothetical protein